MCSTSLHQLCDFIHFSNAYNFRSRSGISIRKWLNFDISKLYWLWLCLLTLSQNQLQSIDKGYAKFALLGMPFGSYVAGKMGAFKASSLSPASRVLSWKWFVVHKSGPRSGPGSHGSNLSDVLYEIWQCRLESRLGATHGSKYEMLPKRSCLMFIRSSFIQRGREIR